MKDTAVRAAYIFIRHAYYIIGVVCACAVNEMESAFHFFSSLTSVLCLTNLLLYISWFCYLPPSSTTAGSVTCHPADVQQLVCKLSSAVFFSATATMIKKNCLDVILSLLTITGLRSRRSCDLFNKALTLLLGCSRNRLAKCPQTALWRSLRGMTYTNWVSVNLYFVTRNTHTAFYCFV